MSLSEIAHSDEHKLTHKPFNPYCPVCIYAKSKNKPHRRRAFNRVLDHFGKIVTLDHTEILDKDFEPGVFGMKSCLEVLDLHTRFGYPVREKDLATTERYLRDFKGDDVINRVYSDGHDSIGAACRAIGIPQELSQPGVPQNNGIIENKVATNLRVSGPSLAKPAFLYACGPMRRESMPLSKTRGSGRMGTAHGLSVLVNDQTSKGYLSGVRYGLSLPQLSLRKRR
jgi:hypothetical protein